jgi:tRNA(Ile2) C34 agmatinyltransferase TiaS
MSKNEKVVPFCTNCNTDEYVVTRSGGGYRCEGCKRIFDEHYQILGEDATHVSVEDIMRNMEKRHIGKKNQWLVG